MNADNGWKKKYFTKEEHTNCLSGATCSVIKTYAKTTLSRFNMLYLGINACTYTSMHSTINEEKYHKYKEEGVTKSFKGSQGNSEIIYNLKN